MHRLPTVTYSFFFVFWSLVASAQTYTGNPQDIDQILNQSKLFSQYFVAGDTEKLVNLYTPDGKLFPNNQKILEGTEALMRFWTPNEGNVILYHKVTSEEIKVLGDEAYDYGYYEGRSKSGDEPAVSWQGKYVIVWKKIDGQWKMYLDIWNRVSAED